MGGDGTQSRPRRRSAAFGGLEGRSSVSAKRPRLRNSVASSGRSPSAAVRPTLRRTKGGVILTAARTNTACSGRTRVGGPGV